MSSFTQPMVGDAVTRVLLAEDKQTASLLSDSLAQSGYDVVNTDEGFRALSILQSDDPPPLALLDWNMPGMNGLEICRRLRNSKRRRSSYVILLTPCIQQHDRVEGLAAGADDCILTPADPRELEVRLQVGAKILLERALYESEERFYNSFEHAGIGMAIVSVAGEFEKVNRAICSLLGYSPDELKSLGFHDVCHGEDRPSSHDLLWGFIEGGDRRSAESERRFITKTGAPIWISLTISLVLDSDDLPACFVLQAQDITARRKADLDLKESLAASKQALKALADQKHAMDQHAIIDATDVRGRITYVNDKFCASSKYSREELGAIANFSMPDFAAEDD